MNSAGLHPARGFKLILLFPLCLFSWGCAASLIQLPENHLYEIRHIPYELLPGLEAGLKERKQAYLDWRPEGKRLRLWGRDFEIDAWAEYFEAVDFRESAAELKEKYGAAGGSGGPVLALLDLASRMGKDPAKTYEKELLDRLKISGDEAGPSGRRSGSSLDFIESLSSRPYFDPAFAATVPAKMKPILCDYYSIRGPSQLGGGGFQVGWRDLEPAEVETLMKSSGAVDALDDWRKGREFHIGRRETLFTLAIGGAVLGLAAGLASHSVQNEAQDQGVAAVIWTAGGLTAGTLLSALLLPLIPENQPPYTERAIWRQRQQLRLALGLESEGTPKRFAFNGPGKKNFRVAPLLGAVALGAGGYACGVYVRDHTGTALGNPEPAPGLGAVAGTLLGYGLGYVFDW